MKLFQSLSCPHCGVSLNNHMDATVCPRCNKDLREPVGAEPLAPDVASSPQSPLSSGSIMRRYTDAYRVARTITAFGATVKVIAFVIAAVVALGGVAAASQSGMLVLAGILIAAIVGIPVYVLGVIVSALGQTLKATLDTAVHSSPFLSKAEMQKIMSLD